MQYQRFYSELAKMLYAVACVKGKIAPKEREELLAIVKEELVPMEKHTDLYGTDAAFYTAIEFDILEETMQDPEEAFESFLKYVQSHHTAVDNRLRETCLKVAHRIAEAWHKTNKHERELLKRLQQALAALPKQH